MLLPSRFAHLRGFARRFVRGRVSGLALVCTLCAAGVAGAQTQGKDAVKDAAAPLASAPASPTAAPSASAQRESRGSQKIERIVVEDSGTRIDELRVGGETQSITVQPKGNLPSYSVQPVTGARTWKIFSF
jgi:hypothetical protein